MIDLDMLVAPLTAEEFLRGHWPNVPGCFAGDPARLAPLVESIPELASAGSAMDVFEDRVSIIRPDGFFANVPNGKSALPFYNAEFTCLLRSAERFIPGLQLAIDQISGELGMPGSAFHCDIFASTGKKASAYEDASGLAMHSDAEVNLALLLTGRKVWQWAPNEHVRNQTTTVLRGDRQVNKSHFRFADKLPFPTSMPNDASSAEVTSGGMMFMPRGWWHTTKAYGECLQVNFAMIGPTWISVLTEALSDRLMGDADWREYAYGIAGTGAPRSNAEADFVRLLSDLAGYLQGGTAAKELLSSLAPHHADDQKRSKKA
ncbi:cupin-like domain-containing protein [Streptomyces sp. NBC_01622]|uniref:cupin-like domain-containing protein n=1 Tax=Streptomyces sp. NBC_01622 TaxID=2975903 RepID=UPI0038637E6F|nr:cupin-like domain-containing protein [Streptomyces sp. NBC_01622]